MSETNIAKSIEDLERTLNETKDLLAQFERYAMREMLALMSQLCRNDSSLSGTDERLRNLVAFAGNAADYWKMIDGHINVACGWIALIGDATTHNVEPAQRNAAARSGLRIVGGGEDGDAA